MLIIVATLLILLSAFHSLIGERQILQPINKADNLPKIWGNRQYTFRTIQATWHLVSILWSGIASYLLLIQFNPEKGTKGFLIIFGIIFAVLTILPLIWSAGKHKSWIAFGVISILLLVKATII